MRYLNFFTSFVMLFNVAMNVAMANYGLASLWFLASMCFFAAGVIRVLDYKREKREAVKETIVDALNNISQKS